jgi:hypothetical protein
MATVKFKRERYGQYAIETPKYTLTDLANDLPDEASAALDDIPNAEHAQFSIENDHGALIGWVTRGQSADWYEFDQSTNKWNKRR